MMSRLSNQAIVNYKLINYLLLGVFVVGLFFVIFSPVSVSCYYTKTYGISCPSCGLTRDFKSILQLKTTDLISASSLLFFSAFSCLFLSRLIASVLIALRVDKRVLILFETVVIISILSLLILARI